MKKNADKFVKLEAIVWKAKGQVRRCPGGKLELMLALNRIDAVVVGRKRDQIPARYFYL
jgi:hypothetical protein